MRRARLAAAALAALLQPAMAAAQSWNAATDFYAGLTAPGGNPWAYGMGDGTSFTADDVVGDCYNTAGFSCHLRQGTYPIVGLYTGGDITGAANGTGIYLSPTALFMHPGNGDGQSAVVRFTAPTAGLYALTGRFTAADYGFPNGDGIIAQVLMNGGTLFSEGLRGGAYPNAASGGASLLYSNGAITLAAGDRIDFLVNKNGSHGADSTAFSADITLIEAAPVPEPGEWAMIGAGLAVAGVAARRRRPRV